MTATTKPFTRISRKQIHADAWQKIFVDTIQFKDQHTGTYTFADRMSGVGIVVTTDSKQVLLQKEYRYVIDAFDWEIPGGGIDAAESPLDAAKRELQEETGIVAENLEFLGTFYPLNSFNTEQVSLFHLHLSEIPAMSDHSESSEAFGERKFFSFNEVLAMIDSNEIIDAMTAHAVQQVIRKVDR